MSARAARVLAAQKAVDPMTPSIKQLSPHCWVATWEDTLVQLWGIRTEAATVREVRAFANQYFERRPGPRLGVVFIEADSEPPDARARSELKSLGQLFESNLSAMAYVYGGTGFRATAIRSVMAAILFVNSLPMRLSVKTFSKPTDACEWLGSKVPYNEALNSLDRTNGLSDILRRFAARERPVGVATTL